MMVFNKGHFNLYLNFFNLYLKSLKIKVFIP